MGCSLLRKLLFDDSDEDEIMRQVLKGSTSQRKRRRYIKRNHLVGHKRLYLDYLANTMVPERPIGRKVEKAKRKRKDGDNEFRDYLANKLHYIQESQEQDKEALCIKAERVRLDAQRADIEKEMLRLETIKEEERIMTKDTSGMVEKERIYFENLKDQILARQKLE